MTTLCSPLLGLTDKEAALIGPDELDRLEADALREFKAARKYTHRQWDYLVETWNDLTPEERRRRSATCARTGRHDWRKLPMAGAKVCQRCCSYMMEGE